MVGGCMCKQGVTLWAEEPMPRLSIEWQHLIWNMYTFIQTTSYSGMPIIPSIAEALSITLLKCIKVCLEVIPTSHDEVVVMPSHSCESLVLNFLWQWSPTFIKIDTYVMLRMWLCFQHWQVVWATRVSYQTDFAFGVSHTGKPAMFATHVAWGAWSTSNVDDLYHTRVNSTNL